MNDQYVCSGRQATGARLRPPETSPLNCSVTDCSSPAGPVGGRMGLSQSVSTLARTPAVGGGNCGGRGLLIAQRTTNTRLRCASQMPNPPDFQRSAQETNNRSYSTLPYAGFRLSPGTYNRD
jgi:hypothetical protein